jgi:peptidoglycan/xylan/chitin deacetylase (PgdA/CDA1 family)
MNRFAFGTLRAAFGGLAGAVAFVIVWTTAVPANSHAPIASSAATRAAASVESRLPPARSAPGPVEKLFGSEVRRIPTTRRVVALTFNAAWEETGVDAALAVLRERKAPATFFLTGQFAERHPAAARAMAAEHGIGNHSYSHPRFGGLTSGEAAEEVLRADRAIRRASGAVPLPFFRFPYSATTARGIADVNALGFADIEFTADTNGYLGTAGGMTVQKAVDRAIAALTPGEIVQMHVGTPDGHGPALDVLALPRIIDALHARGYQVVDLRSLLGA